jgi:hypothetical protein
MLTGSSFFRGVFTRTPAAEGLLKELCRLSELTPEYWNDVEPINRPFRPDGLVEVIDTLAPSITEIYRRLVFFVRKTAPRYLLSIDLRLLPAPGRSPHNMIKFRFPDNWTGGEHRFAHYL